MIVQKNAQVLPTDGASTAGQFIFHHQNPILPVDHKFTMANEMEYMELISPKRLLQFP